MAATRRNSPVAAVFAWWLATLGASLPPGLRRALGIARDRLIVDWDGEYGRICRWSDDAEEPLGALIPGDAPPAAVDDADIILRLPASAGLRREVQVPIAAAGTLSEALGYEIERQTPFRLDQVRFAHREIGRDPIAGTITVDLLVAPRDRLRAALEAIRPWSIVPTGLTIGTDEAALALNLLPPRPRAVAASSPWNSLWWSVAAAALLLAIGTPVFRAELDRRQATHRLATAEAAARPLMAERAKVGDRLEALRLIAQRSGAEIPVVVLLEEISRLLPDDVSLSQLTIRKEGVDLQGIAASAADVVSRLDASGRYATISFQSPVVRDPVTGQERFQLSARFRMAAG